MEVLCIFLTTFCEVCGVQLNFAESKSLFTITTLMFEFCVDNLQHNFDRVVLITDLVRRSQNASNVLFVFSFHS